MVHTSNPSRGKTEAGGWPELLKETLSQKRKGAKSVAAASQQGALASHARNVSTREHRAVQNACLCDFSYELRVYSPRSEIHDAPKLKTLSAGVTPGPGNCQNRHAENIAIQALHKKTKKDCSSVSLPLQTGPEGAGC